MNEDKKPWKPLFWHQGVFLQPQHFQYTDMYHQTAYYPLLRIANPYFWGVVNLEVNESGLANGVFEVEACEVLMPNGTLVNYPGDSALSSRTFTTAWTDRLRPFTVCLGIRKMNPKGGNVTVLSAKESAAEVKTRFLTLNDPEDIPDIHEDGPDAQIRTLTYVTELFWETEAEGLQDYELLPIAQIVRDGDTIHMSPTFIPPCLHIVSSGVLLKTVKLIRDELAGRARQLEEYKTPVGVAGAEPDIRSIPHRLALQLLAQYVPMLFHLVDTPTLHPWQIYGILRQLIGGISTLSTRVNFLGEDENGNTLLPPYDHTDLGNCFKNAYGLIIRLLNEITIEAESLIPMPQVSQGQFKGEIPEDLLEPQNLFYLALRTSVPFEELLDAFMGFAKVGSEEQVRLFAEHSLPGLPLRHLKIQPEGIPRRPNTSYFSLDRRNTVWDAIRQHRNIVLLWDDAPEDLRAEVIALKR